jgi:hypothetical protein
VVDVAVIALTRPYVSQRRRQRSLRAHHAKLSNAASSLIVRQVAAGRRVVVRKLSLEGNVNAESACPQRRLLLEVNSLLRLRLAVLKHLDVGFVDAVQGLHEASSVLVQDDSPAPLPLSWLQPAHKRSARRSAVVSRYHTVHGRAKEEFGWLGEKAT